MSHTDTHVRVAGAWLGVGSLLLAVTLALHGPLAGGIEEQMRSIAESGGRWKAVHWMAAAALSLFAVASLVVLGAGSRLTENGWTMSAWTVLPVAALWTTTTAVSEATVIADAAAAHDLAVFQAWWSFGEGKAHGFAFVALAVALIAGNEARTSPAVMPAWASWIGVVVALTSFLGWALSSWFGVAAVSVVWVVSSLVMSLWLLWFGAAMARTVPRRDHA